MSMETVKDVYERFGQGDLEGVFGLFSPDIVFHLAESHPYSPGGDALVGRDEIAERFFARIGPDWENFAVHPDSWHGAGVAVVVEGLQRKRALDGHGPGLAVLSSLAGARRARRGVPAVHRHGAAPPRYGS